MKRKKKVRVQRVEVRHHQKRRKRVVVMVIVMVGEVLTQSLPRKCAKPWEQLLPQKVAKRWVCPVISHASLRCVLLCQSEASLDDDAMMAVDDALGQVFRTRFALKHQRKQQKGMCSKE